jgi:hypothetical protein
MKKLLLALLLLSSCKSSNNTDVEEQVTPLKHQKGDVVYVKPDSVKVYIYKKRETYYKGSYFDKHGKEQTLSFDDLQLY